MLKKLEGLFDELFSARQLVPAGFYQYRSGENAEYPYKLQLRVEEDGSGILILNASTVLHLNQTATEFAYYLVQDMDQQKIVSLVAERYKTNTEQISEDLKEFISKIDALLQTEDLDPVTYLNIDRVSPYSKRLTAPYRVDCALTYQVRNESEATSAPTDRVTRELTAEEWQQALDIIHAAGIPQVVFTGGEPTLRPDLPELIQTAEELGVVCGLLTDGLSLTNKKAISSLLNNGLDHIMLLADASQKKFWQALGRLIPEDIALTVHITLTPENASDFQETIAKIADAGVTNLSLSTTDDDLTGALEDARQTANERGLSLIWDLPVPYSSHNPVSLELRDESKKVPDGAGRAWLYIEPDGDVLPAQGINNILGNILRDPWQNIWKKSRS